MFENLRFGVVGVMMLGGFASADVLDFEVVKARFFSQTSTVAPTVAHTYQLAAEVDLQAGDIGSGNVNGLPLVQIDPEYWEYLADFPNQAMMDASFPAGTAYDLQLQGGAIGTRNETLLLPTPAVYPSIPGLLPISYSAMQAADATQSLLIQWSAPTGNANVVGLEIYDPLTGDSVVDVQPALLQTSYLVPAGTMQQNTAYEFVLFFAKGNFFDGQPAPAGFGINAGGVTAYISEVEVSFTTSAGTPCVDLVYYDVVKAGSYAQTADAAQPTQALGYEFSTCLEAAVGGSFATTSFFVNGGFPGQTMTSNFPGEWEFEEEFFGPTAKADMDAAYPSTANYTLGGGAGTLGLRSQTLTMATEAYPPVPVFLGTSYSDLQGMNPTQALPLTWALATGNTDRTFIEIYDVLSDGIILELELPLVNASFDIPAGTLQAGRAYEFHVYFANVAGGVGENCPGFGVGSEELTAYLSDTLIAFTPEAPFDQLCNGDGGDQMGCTNCPCGNNSAPGTIGGCLNSAGTGARLLVSGDTSVSLPPMSSSDLRFSISGAPGNAFCILNSGNGLAPGNMANPCFGMGTGGLAPAFDGLRCAIMNTRRHGGRSADGNGDVGVTNNPWGGEGGPPVGLAVAGGGFSAGQTRYFQVINRDDPLLSCMRALNTSQAVRITFTP